MSEKETEKLRTTDGIDVLLLAQGSVTIHDVSTMLQLPYATAQRAVGRMEQRGHLERTEPPPAEPPPPPEPCPTCGHVPDETRPPAGPPRQYYRLPDARAEKLRELWTDELVEQTIEEFERRIAAEDEELRR